MTTGDFAERMRGIAEAIVSRADSCHNEEQTKQSLILPVIHALGYEIFNPDEVVMEFACDAPVLKARNGKPESVDYAIRIGGRVAILIEAKGADENLDRHGGQLARYFMATDCRHAILTNGLEWRFFSDLDKDNVMDGEAYRTIGMASLTDDDIEFLSGFRKEGFSEDGLRRDAEKAMYAAKISDYIKRNIIDSMSDEIIRVILGHVYDGVRSAAVVERFRPMIAEEFDKCVAEKYAIKSSLVRKTGGRADAVIDLPVDTDDEDDATDDRDVASTSPDGAVGVAFPIEVFFASGDGSYDAKALYLGGNQMTILAGSKVARDEKPYIARNAHDLRERFVDADGIVTDDVTVDSASTAGAFVNGGVCDAGRYWKVADGRNITQFLGARTWGEASRIEPNVASDTKAPANRGDEIGNPIVNDATDVPIFMRTRHQGTPTSYDATATYLGGRRCRLHAGSQCAKRCDDYASNTTRRLRDEHLDEDGIVVKELEGSLSMVGTVVRGSTCDGTRRWRLDDGRRIREILPDIKDDGESNVTEGVQSAIPSDDPAWPIRMSYMSSGRSAGYFSATAIISKDGKTVVEAGSLISPIASAALNPCVIVARERELQGLETDEHGSYVLAHPVSFDSVSTAGSFVCGVPVSGNLVWRDAEGRKLRDLRQ